MWWENINEVKMTNMSKIVNLFVCLSHTERGCVWAGLSQRVDQAQVGSADQNMSVSQ